MDGWKIIVDNTLSIAFSSIFWWIVIGSVSPIEIFNCHSTFVSLTILVEHLVNRFWHMEEPQVASLQFTEDRRCESIFHDYSTRIHSCRFAVPLFFQILVRASTFLGSRSVAIKRFECLERKLEADNKLRILYNEFIIYINYNNM